MKRFALIAAGIPLALIACITGFWTLAAPLASAPVFLGIAIASAYGAFRAFRKAGRLGAPAVIDWSNPPAPPAKPERPWGK